MLVNGQCARGQYPLLDAAVYKSQGGPVAGSRCPGHLNSSLFSVCFINYLERGVEVHSYNCAFVYFFIYCCWVLPHAF